MSNAKALPFEPGHEVDGQLHPFQRLAEDEFARVKDEWLVIGDVEQLGQVRLRVAHVDVGVAVVAEDAERAVEVQVDRRWLEVARVVWIDADPAGFELGPDVAVGQDAHVRRAWPLSGEPRSS